MHTFLQTCTHTYTHIHTIHTSFHTHAHTRIQTKSPDAYMRTCLACSRRESTTCTSSHIRTCETQSSTVQARIHYTHACTCACTRTHACTHPHAHALVGMHTSRHSHRRESAPLCTSVRWNARTVTGAILPAHVQHTLPAIQLYTLCCACGCITGALLLSYFLRPTINYTLLQKHACMNQISQYILCVLAYFAHLYA